MRRIYVVTHPEATHRVQSRVGGWFDSELTGTGHVHARGMAERLVDDFFHNRAVISLNDDTIRLVGAVARQSDMVIQRCATLGNSP